MGCFSLHKPYPAFIYMQNYGLQMFSTSSLHLKKRNGWPKAENLLTGIGFRQCIWESVKVSIKHKLLLHPPPNDELFFLHMYHIPLRERDRDKAFERAQWWNGDSGTERVEIYSYAWIYENVHWFPALYYNWK